MQIQLLRHATLVVTMNQLCLLVDPMLSPKGAMDPVGNSSVVERIPMTDLPMSENEIIDLIGQMNGVLVTHLHRDHWDARAVELLPKTLPILCPPECVERIQQAGFLKVIPIAESIEWGGVNIQRTGGQHGTGEIGAQMGIVSGFVLTAEAEPTLYITGDTVWCAEVEDVLARYQPKVIVVNSGAAQFLTGDPITMTADDIARVCEKSAGVPVVAVHMDTVNHCLLKRDKLWEYVEEKHLAQVIVPDDGQTLEF